jgi:glycerol-3-phosphate acyltransferase PlsX
MGADHPPHRLAEGVEKAVHAAPDAAFTLFLSPEASPSVQEIVAKFLWEGKRVELSLWPEVIQQQDEPLGALRKKRKSSLVQGIRALKRRRVDAFISCGNTGALFISSSLYLPRLSGIRRPALLAHVPTQHGQLAVLDVGSSLQCKAAHLIGYAELGASFKRIQGLPRPKVGLLNVGIESRKGTLEHQHTYDKLKALAAQMGLFDFVGNVEGRAIFQNPLDVLVTDGFTGNVFLKTLEGAGQFILEQFAKLLEPSKLDDVKSLLSHREYPGAILLGVEGLVMKCHGDAAPHTLFQGIIKVIDYVKQGIIPKLRSERAEYLSSAADVAQGGEQGPV